MVARSAGLGGEAALQSKITHQRDLMKAAACISLASLRRATKASVLEDDGKAEDQEAEDPVFSFTPLNLGRSIDEQVDIRLLLGRRLEVLFLATAASEEEAGLGTDFLSEEALGFTLDYTDSSFIKPGAEARALRRGLLDWRALMMKTRISTPREETGEEAFSEKDEDEALSANLFFASQETVEKKTSHAARALVAFLKARCLTVYKAAVEKEVSSATYELERMWRRQLSSSELSERETPREGKENR